MQPLASLAACVPFAPLACAPAIPVHAEPTATTMQRVFDALVTLLPGAISGSPRAWAAAPGAVHGARSDASFRFLSDSLASDARMLERELERDQYPTAAYFTERVVQTCVACHVRLPAAAPNLQRTLLQRIDGRKLRPSHGRICSWPPVSSTPPCRSTRRSSAGPPRPATPSTSTTRSRPT